MVICPKTIIEGGIQMIICPLCFYNIPGMTVLDSFFRIISANSNHTPHSQCIQKNLYCFCNAFTDSYALTQRTDNFVGIRFFQLIITNILTNKIMYILFFFPLGKLHSRADKLFHTGFHGFLMLPDLIFVK